jgi:hypothetical protein
VSAATAGEWGRPRYRHVDRYAAEIHFQEIWFRGKTGAVSLAHDSVPAGILA